MKRIGEKIGWTMGWLGAFLWVGILAVVRLFQGRYPAGFGGIAIFTIALLLVALLAPWRRPDTAYWKLMLPMFVLSFLAAGLFIWDEGGMAAAGIHWWDIFPFLPLLMPLLFIGNKTWNSWRKSNS